MNQLLAKVASQNPSSKAIEDGPRILTYNDLLEKADNLAQTIQKYPLEPDEAIAVIFGPSVEMVIAQVALLRLNLTSVPLNPGLPKLRIQEMLGDIKVRYAIASDEVEDLDLSVITMPAGDSESCQQSSSSSQTALKDPACSHILYTSGSTGKPKPVEITPESLVYLATSTAVTPLRATDRVALINNSGFDLSLFEVWSSLLSGSTIVVVPRQVVIDPLAFRDFIAEYHLSVIFLTTSLFNATALACPTAFQNVRELLTAGEVASPLAMRTVLESGGPPERLWNTYGPTETTTFSTIQLVTFEEAQREKIGIGQPSGDKVFLLDDDSLPVSTNNKPAEIFIGGPGMSSGYRGRPEETASHYLDFPGHDLGIDTEEIVRLYKTGDLAEWRDYSNKTLDFVGRVDRQVKQDGFRIELEEVEKVLLSSGWFTRSVVQQLRREDQTEPFLVAYVTSKVAGIPKQRVMKWASGRMPAYMLPRDIMFCSSFPLTPSNKVDLKALEKGYWESYEDAQKKTGGESHDSEFIAHVRDLWSSLLGVPKISDEDDFFTLGGSSIKSATLISKLRVTMGKTISMRALHQNPRFDDFVAYLNEFAEGTVATHQSERWIEDSHLADDLTINPGDAPEWLSEDEGRVFMTGATGFVGVNFLSRLLLHPRVKEVACLVRERNDMTPRLRIEQVMKKYNLWDNTSSNLSKLTVLNGDITKDRLGLSQDDFTWLAGWAGAVFHLGAKVNFCEPYEAHFDTNVLGTKNALQVATSGRLKSFHFTSSIDAWGPNGLILGTRKCLEDDTLEPNLKGLPYDIGYAASKWASEQMVRGARDRGLPVAIYRPGFVTGDSKTGAGNPDDFFARLMVGSIQLRAFPHLPNQRMEYVTVDYVCDAMLHIASNNANLGRSYSLVAPDPADSVNLEKTVGVINDAGYSVERIPYWDWVHQLQDPKRQENPLMPLMPLLQEKVWGDLTRFETSRDTPHYDATNTVAALADAPDIGYRPFNPDQLNRFLEFWRAKGFYSV
jgi:amino acid adenylation domain-containing protein/thioester reductase-like protein